MFVHCGCQATDTFDPLAALKIKLPPKGNYGLAVLQLTPNKASRNNATSRSQGRKVKCGPDYRIDNLSSSTVRESGRENLDRSLPAYSTSNVSLGYTLKPKKVAKEAIVKVNFNNIFNKRYAASGWVYSAICDSYGHPKDNRYYQIGFIPMAGFTVLGNLTLRF